METGRQNAKTLALIAGCPFPFYFALFYIPPPLFAPVTLASFSSVVVSFDFVLFSLALARSRSKLF